MEQNVDLKYIVDKLIESGERNLDLQSSTLRELHELKSVLEEKGRDHVALKEKLDDVIKVTDRALDKITIIEHRGTVESVDTIKAGQIQCMGLLTQLKSDLSSLKSLYNQVRNLMIAITVIASLLTLLGGILFKLMK